MTKKLTPAQVNALELMHAAGGRWLMASHRRGCAGRFADWLRLHRDCRW